MVHICVYNDSTEHLFSFLEVMKQSICVPGERLEVSIRKCVLYTFIYFLDTSSALKCICRSEPVVNTNMLVVPMKQFCLQPYA